MTSLREQFLLEQAREALKRARKAELRTEKLERFVQEQRIPEPGYIAIGFGPTLVGAGCTVTMNQMPHLPCVACRLFVDVETSPKEILAYMKRPFERVRADLTERREFQKPATTIWDRILRWDEILDAFTRDRVGAIYNRVEAVIARAEQKADYDVPPGDFGEVYLIDFRVGRNTGFVTSNPVSVATFRGTVNEMHPEGPAMFMQRCELGQLISLSFENKSPVSVTISASVLALRDDIDVSLSDAEISEIEREIESSLAQ